MDAIVFHRVHFQHRFNIIGLFYRDKTYQNIFDVEMSVRESTAQHMQNILSANLKLLEEVRHDFMVINYHIFFN